jgi:ATP-dependent DNA helicase RecG
MMNLTDKKYIKRAASLLFCNDPEKFITGSYVKIGFFRSNIDLIYQDEIHGNLFEQVDKTLDLLTTKYMKAYTSYQRVQRIEKFLIPPEALRETLTNTIVHKDYSSANPIQISVYEDKIIIWNAGHLPDMLPIEKLILKDKT